MGVGRDDNELDAGEARGVDDLRVEAVSASASKAGVKKSRTGTAPVSRVCNAK
jgi:hypothetical protein